MWFLHYIGQIATELMLQGSCGIGLRLGVAFRINLPLESHLRFCACN